MAGDLRTIDAIVLRLVDVGEADRIATLLAPIGRLDVSIPRARSSRRRFGGLDLLAAVRAEVEGGRRLRSCEVLDSRRHLRDDVVRLALASYVAERAFQAAREGEDCSELHRLVTAALAALDDPTVVIAESWARGFELKLAHVLGVRPTLRACAACGAALDIGGELAFSVAEGGVLLGACRNRDGRAFPVTLTTLAALDAALHRPLTAQATVSWPQGGALEGDRIMDAFLAAHLAPAGRARGFLDQMLRPVEALAVAVLMAGCPSAAPETVSIQGWMYDTPWPEDGRAPFSGAAIDVLDPDGIVLAEGAEPYANDLGYYVIAGLEPSRTVHLVIRPDEAGPLTTILSGRSEDDDLYLDPGTLHVWPRATLSYWQRVSGLSGGAMVLGRLADPEGDLGTRIVVEDGAGGSIEAFYPRTEEEDPQAVGTAGGGFFFAAGLSPGPLSIRVFDPDGTRLTGRFGTHGEEGAVTSLIGFTLAR